MARLSPTSTLIIVTCPDPAASLSSNSPHPGQAFGNAENGRCMASWPHVLFRTHGITTCGQCLRLSPEWGKSPARCYGWLCFEIRASRLN